MLREYVCSPGPLKFLLVLLNIIFVLGSITIIGFGIYIQIDNNISPILNRLTDAAHFQGQALGYFPIFMIGGGIFTFLVAIIGFMGVMWNSKWVLYIYSVIVGIIMVVQIIGFSVAMGYKSDLESVYRKSLLIVLTTALNRTDTKVLDAFADLETTLKCCGVNGLDDYNGHEPKNVDCYRYKNGCANELIKIVQKYIPIVGTCLGIAALFELFGIICAIALAIRLKDIIIVHQNPNSNNLGINLPLLRRKNYTKFS